VKGFLPVREDEEEPTRFELPLVFVLLEMPLAPKVDPYLPAGLASTGAIFNASALKASMLYIVSLIFSFGTVYITFNHSPIIENNFFFAFCLIMFLNIFSAFWMWPLISCTASPLVFTFLSILVSKILFKLAAH